jgi:PAS domain S-box-containing protein
MQKKPTSSAKTAELNGSAKVELRDFADKGRHGPMMAELYREAEAQLRKQQGKNRKSKAEAAKPEADPQRLLHELQVHQIELELQNAELQNARNELEIALEKYTDLYDFAPVGYFTFAAGGTINLVNLTGAHLVGMERSRLVGQPFGMLVSAAHRPVFHAFLKQVLVGQTKLSVDVDLLNKGRTVVQVVRIRAQRLPAGQVCRAAVMDITELKREENKVRVSEIRYRRLFEAAHDGVLLLDPVTRKITDANPFMTKLLGYSHGQLIGKELFEIGLLKDEAASKEAFQKLKQKREVRYENLPLESKTGRHQEVEVVANLYDENGHAVIQCNIRDITARKTAEDALRASEERYRTLFDLGPTAVYSCDASGVIQNFNNRAAELWGRKPASGDTSERFCGSLKLFRPDGGFMPHHRCPMAEVVGGKIAAVHDAEVLIERPDGSRISVIVNIRPLKNERGEITGAINCFYDITERKAAEKALRRLDVLAASNRKLEKEIVRRQTVEESLKKSEQDQSRLLTESHQMQERLRQLSRQVLMAQEEERKRISRELHDVIAQTLTGINIRLATLKKEAGRNTKGFDLTIARTQRLVEKSVNLVHDFARELRPAVLDDLGLIPALHTFMKNFTEQTGVRTQLTAFAEVEKLETSGRTALFRIAQETFTNVARHAKASRVKVNIRKFPDSICMKINDDGKSFKVDRALHASTGKRLGLLGMRERLEMIGGSFEVESSPGKGTTIIAQIPLAKRGGGGGRKKR